MTLRDKAPFEFLAGRREPKIPADNRSACAERGTPARGRQINNACSGGREEPMKGVRNEWRRKTAKRVKKKKSSASNILHLTFNISKIKGCLTMSYS